MMISPPTGPFFPLSFSSYFMANYHAAILSRDPVLPWELFYMTTEDRVLSALDKNNFRHVVLFKLL